MVVAVEVVVAVVVGVAEVVVIGVVATVMDVGGEGRVGEGKMEGVVPRSVGAAGQVGR
jgi:hypothetical protein